MVQKKLNLFEKNVLERHQESYNEHDGVSLSNDYMQVSQILEDLKISNPKAFNVLYAVIYENTTLKRKAKQDKKTKTI